MTSRVAIVLVSHSRQLAAGTLELAQQMAPDVRLVAVGGMPDGALGTSFDGVDDAVRVALRDGEDVVLLADLGSAMLTVDSVIELLDEGDAARARLADAPFVEGAVAAGVAAQGGGGLAAVHAAAEGAGALYAPIAAAAARAGSPAPAEASARLGSAADVLETAGAERSARRTVMLRNALGLHARPAAVLARLVAGLDATVRVEGVDAASVLELMKLGVTGGREILVEATGPEAQQAVDAVVEAVESSFGEV